MLQPSNEQLKVSVCASDKGNSEDIQPSDVPIAREDLVIDLTHPTRLVACCGNSSPGSSDKMRDHHSLDIPNTHNLILLISMPLSMMLKTQVWLTPQKC